MFADNIVERASVPTGVAGYRDALCKNPKNSCHRQCSFLGRQCAAFWVHDYENRLCKSTAQSERGCRYSSVRTD